MKTSFVPVSPGLSRWEFEVWTLWCHSPSASTHQLSAGETHQPERETERKAADKVSMRTRTTFRESLRFIGNRRVMK